MAGAQIDTASVGYQWIKNQTINGLNIKRSDPEKAFVGDEYLFDEFVARDTHEARLAPAVSTPPPCARAVQACVSPAALAALTQEARLPDLPCCWLPASHVARINLQSQSRKL